MTFSHRPPEGRLYGLSKRDAEDVRVTVLSLRLRRADTWSDFDPDAAHTAAEDYVTLRPVGGMRPDEYLYAVHCHGVYVACRRVDTVDLGAARRAGL